MLFDPTHEIIISADASLYELGAVLSQKVKGIERPVWFCSRTLSQAEQNYTQTYKEALALILLLKSSTNLLYIT